MEAGGLSLIHRKKFGKTGAAFYSANDLCLIEEQKNKASEREVDRRLF